MNPRPLNLMKGAWKPLNLIKGASLNPKPLNAMNGTCSNLQSLGPLCGSWRLLKAWVCSVGLRKILLSLHVYPYNYTYIYIHTRFRVQGYVPTPQTPNLECHGGNLNFKMSSCHWEPPKLKSLNPTPFLGERGLYRCCPQSFRPQYE